MPEKRELEDQPSTEASDNLNKELRISSADFTRTQSLDELLSDDMEEYEDMWEDDIDEEVVVAQNSDDEDPDDTEMNFEEQDEEEEKTQVYLPGQQLEKEEVLVPDNSAYECLHTMGVEWPCLSFDILKDGLGFGRSRFPLTTYLVSGSQADKPKDNRVYVMKMSHIHKTKHDDDEDGEMNEDSDDENDLDEDPILEYKAIPHYGSINRIRAMPHPEKHIVATWSEVGKVHVWDLTSHVHSLDNPGMSIPKETKPYHTNHKHGRVEGYGLDWSPVEVGRLLSGDMASKIYLTQASSSVFTTDDQPFLGHEASVEDIQWSPSEKSVFASCSVDKTIKIWDTRTHKKPQLSIVAHETDVNVINWNKSVDHLIASGSDDGVFSVWDLRNWVSCASTNSSPSPAATFKWHQKPITSLEWHPIESSMICVSGADNQITLWDLALEADKEEELVGQEEQVTLPPQLLFIHQGQTHIKEVHMHQQIPGLILSTAFEGFHVFKTINS